MVAENLKPQYDAVLKDLETERTEVHKEVASLQRKLKELDYTIATLSRRLGIIPTFPAMGHNGDVLQSAIVDSNKYARTSIRWAILLELNKPTGAPMSAQEIADALQAGGIPTRATNFVNTVSVTLSNMKKDKNEVDVTEGKWQITDNGRSAADHIANKLRRRTRGERIEAPEI